ncbi:hypothetical protein H8356DRAFT_1326866 [Neocallimastix lanati (nom. inval.)]|nr:hypothetical protein H8356DRAFT_1326866 [Neocallimastix sp. JGI-2020a]
MIVVTKCYDITNNNIRNNIVNNNSIDSENKNIDISDSEDNKIFTNSVVNRSIGENRVNIIKKALYSIQGYLKNPHIPIPYKQMLFSAIVSGQVSYHAPLLGSNKERGRSTQTLVIMRLYWIEGFSNGNSYTSLYCVSKELNIPALSVKYKESKNFNKQIIFKENSSSSFLGMRGSFKGTNYDKYKYIETRKLFKLCIELRSSFKYNTTFAIRSSVLFNNCSKRLAMLWRKCTVVHPLDYLNNMKIFINKYIYIFLLGGTSTLDKLQFDTGERGYLSEQLLNSSQGKKSFSTRSADVGPIWFKNCTISSPIIQISDMNTNSLVLLIESVENSLVDTTLSILKILKKLAKPSYSSAPSFIIKSKEELSITSFKDLIKNIPTFSDAIEVYWSDIDTKQEFNWILCLRCEYKHNTTIAFRIHDMTTFSWFVFTLKIKKSSSFLPPFVLLEIYVLHEFLLELQHNVFKSGSVLKRVRCTRRNSNNRLFAISIQILFSRTVALDELKFYFNIYILLDYILNDLIRSHLKPSTFKGESNVKYNTDEIILLVQLYIHRIFHLK